MKNPRTIVAVLLALIVLGGLALAFGGDNDPTANPTPGDAVETPTATATGPGALPPEFFECLAAQGVVIESPDEIHSVPPQALEACFGSLHGTGGPP